ncbi:family 16 glycosylhydrolase [Chitinophaga rhizosphaerae]|uniref:family 16 glycosylhydrolase n=1 Tax=Chitinophaga rhizosphaerae TaxID=1864947 RepID=UPI000F808B93|nr:family 16 glycosylhydrolase [Chitinophaga rhizosphaerae]
MKNSLHTRTWVNLLIVASLFSCKKSIDQEQGKQLLPSQVAKSTGGSGSLVVGDDMIWSDEFNTAGGMNPDNWIFSNRNNSSWAKFLTALPEYATSDGNDMVLKMDTALIPGDNIPYHTGGIESRNKFYFTYGMVEVRMKFDEATGAWPAFWMMPQTYPYGGWPGCGEIDVAEHFNTSNVTLQNVFFRWYNTSHGASYTKNAYNRYVVVWTPTAIRFFVNGKFTTAVNRPANSTWETWPYDQPCYIILNQSGGAGSTSTVDRTKLPFHNRVDYVRVYQSPSYLFNAGFEYSADLTPWAAWQPAGTVSVVNTDANSGTKAIRLQGGECSAEQLITGLAPNTTYTFGGYGKKSIASAGASIGVKSYGGTAVGASITGTAYQQHSVTFTTGASNTSAIVYIYKNSSSGTVYADDFYLSEQ